MAGITVTSGVTVIVTGGLVSIDGNQQPVVGDVTVTVTASPVCGM
jgi:hypothetical protein